MSLYRNQTKLLFKPLILIIDEFSFCMESCIATTKLSLVRWAMSGQKSEMSSQIGCQDILSDYFLILIISTVMTSDCKSKNECFQESSLFLAIAIFTTLRLYPVTYYLVSLHVHYLNIKIQLFQHFNIGPNQRNYSPISEDYWVVKTGFLIGTAKARARARIKFDMHNTNVVII